ncbi:MULTISPECIES: hypothetical protein [Streptomyces]|uniref:hypothetical protein n=1 Tax=Streptomyces TaxID=1883 RepID=UPI000DA637EB|nr:hypothetical protein [Streptomyces sp. SID7805]MYU55198.1 hypothetical protein [Streptomyces sp. SID7805]
MSIPGDQNNPYAQPQPQPQPNPYGQMPPVPPNPVPAPQNLAPAPLNPYGQPAPPQPPGGYGYPAPGLPPMGAPGAPGGTGRGVSGWLWALGGVVAASAIWASVMFATGGFSAGSGPDLAGYAYTDDLCAATSMTPFTDAHYKPTQNTGTAAKDPNPQHSGAQQTSMDTMWCNIGLTQEGASTTGYSSTWVYNAVTLHKKADPAPEFADIYRSYEKQGMSVGYKVDQVQGLGDEAYLVTRNDAGSTTGSYVILAVRVGGLTYQSTWSSYSTSTATTKQPTSDEVTQMLKSSASETLKHLQRGGGGR